VARRDKWIVRVKKASATPRTTLICLPYAGGSAHLFRAWADGLADDVEVLALCSPGHDARLSEAPHQEWGPLVDDAFAAVSSHLSSPHAFFGHSFGGRLAYELTRRAEKDRPGRTRRLFLSACRAPQRPQRTPFLHTLPDDRLVEALRGMGGGMPVEVLDDPRLRARLLPVVRAEVRLAEQWGDDGGPGVSVPLTVFYGRDDPTDTQEVSRAWREVCEDVECVEMPGGHFFLHSHREALVEAIDTRLRRGDGQSAGE
jgi:surfactin synthase thioesterase subunit